MDKYRHSLSKISTKFKILKRNIVRHTYMFFLLMFNFVEYLLYIDIVRFHEFLVIVSIFISLNAFSITLYISLYCFCYIEISF